MKLASLNDGTRDGKLVVVSKDLTRYCAADNIAPTLQAALDNANASTNAKPIRRCRARTNGPMAVHTSTTSSWCAKRAMPKYRKASITIR
jgi:hypothetical protein